MRKFTLLLLLPLCCLGQKAPVKFGEILSEDLKMTRYEKDTSAAAVVLYDFGESIIQYEQNNGFVLHFDRLQRIKIVTKEGLDHANFSISLYHDGGNTEKITGLKAVTYNWENGKIIESKLKNDAIFKEKVNANLDLMKITMPNVKEGSIVEISYKINSDFLFNFQDWEFQSTIPVVWSEYRARIPQYFSYDKYMQGYITLAINEQNQVPASITLVSKERTGDRTTQTVFSTDKINYQESTYRWAAKDVPAFKPEPYITTSRNYISKINFELASTQFPGQPIKKYMGSWEDINKQYAESEDFGGAVTGNGFLKKIVEEVTFGMTDPKPKMSAIVNYIRNEVAWDGTSRRFTTKTLRKALDEKKGNSAEVNLLLASMLDKAGIRVMPVLISTRDHGFVREATPISSQFNYVICQAVVNEKAYLLDATEKLLPVGMLPERCLNGSGFAVSKEGYQWVQLQTPVKSRTVVNADLALENGSELKGKIQIDRAGYDGLAGRKRYFAKEEDEYVKDFLGNRPWEIIGRDFVNTKEIDQPLKETYDLVVNEHITSTGNTIYLNPLLLFRLESNPFKPETREYPVDYSSPFEQIYMCRITLPAGYEVDELPTAKVLALPSNAGRFTYSVTQAGNILNIVSNFQINKSVFTQLEYPNLREFYNQVVAKHAEQIVLKRNK
jgi:hypothetical protein